MKVLWIALGGAVGTVARYLIGVCAQRVLGSSFPFSTIAINAAGSFLLAVVSYAGFKNAVSPDLRIVLGTGLLGGFTTYSSFNQETIALLQRGATGLALANLAATVALCLLAGGGGLLLARWWLGA
jgi:fluoride exporter